MNPLRSISLRAAMVLALCACPALSADDRDGEPAPSGGGAQPSERAPGRGGPSGAGRDWARQWLDLPAEQRRARLREFLQARLARTEAHRDSLRAAIESIDRGEAVEDIVDRFPAELRPGGAGGGNARGGPPMELSSDFNALGQIDSQRPGEGEGTHGPRGRDHASRKDPRAGSPITDDDRRVFDEFLGSTRPSVQAMFRQLRERDPAEADRKLREALPRLSWLINLRQRDPEMYDLRIRDIRLGRESIDAARAVARHDAEHADSPSAQRDDLVERLRSSLREQFDVRGEILAREALRIENDAAERRKELALRPAAREAAVESTMERLVRRAGEWIRRERERREPSDAGGPPDARRPRPAQAGDSDRQ